MIDKLREWLPILAGLSFWPKLAISVLIVVLAIALVVGLLAAIWAPHRAKLTPIEVEEVLPVCVFSHDKNGAPNLGISLIIKVKNRARKSLVNAVYIRGMSYLQGNDMLAFWGKDGDNMEEVINEAVSKKPYYSVDWRGWFDGENGSVPIEPSEIRYLKCTFLSPVFAGHDRGKIMDLDYVGFGDGSKEPTKKKTHSLLWDFFCHRARSDGKGWEPTGIRKELHKGELVIHLQVNHMDLAVDATRILPMKRIASDDWVEKPVEYLFHDRYN